MRFLIACISKGQEIVKIGMDDGKERWMEVTKAVYGFAKKALKGSEKGGYEGDEVKVTYTQENGKYNCTRIEKVGTTATTKRETSTEGKYVCEDCGATLKDDKYKKCYTCNQKNPVKRTRTTTSGEASYRTPEQLRRDEVGHMVSRSLVALQGHLDPNNMEGVIRTLYTLYTELVK